MGNWFREGFYGGLAVALLIGLFLIWLWRPEHQVQLHSQNLLHAIENKNWERFAGFIGNDYQDEWGNDRGLVLQRTKDVFRYLRTARITAADAIVSTEQRKGHWRARIMIEGDNSELMGLVKDRINSLKTPFQLEWRRVSAKPWDWKLIRVSNAELVLPADLP